MRTDVAPLRWGYLIGTGLAIACVLGPLATGAAAADPKATALYAQATAAQQQGQAKLAVQYYKAALAISPNMTPALHDLAYLQSSSDDPAVRDAKAASTSVNLAMMQLTGMLHQEVQGTLAPAPAGTDQKSLFLSMKACIFNTMAAARAADGDFVRAPLFAAQSVQAAQTLVGLQPTAENGTLLRTVQNTANTVQSKTALHEIPPAPCHFIQQ